MLVVMKAQATEEQIKAVCEHIEFLGIPSASDAGRAAYSNRNYRKPG